MDLLTFAQSCGFGNVRNIPFRGNILPLPKPPRIPEAGRRDPIDIPKLQQHLRPRHRALSLPQSCHRRRITNVPTRTFWSLLRQAGRDRRRRLHAPRHRRVYESLGRLPFGGEFPQSVRIPSGALGRSRLHRQEGSQPTVPSPFTNVSRPEVRSLLLPKGCSVLG